jgi:uncharacterized membrane protein
MASSPGSDAYYAPEKAEISVVVGAASSSITVASIAIVVLVLVAVPFIVYRIRKQKLERKEP